MGKEFWMSEFKMRITHHTVKQNVSSVAGVLDAVQ